MITRDEVEKVVREQLSRVVAMTLQVDDVPPAATLDRATTTIMAVVDEYGATE
jgi:hypothetical protein